MEKYICNVCKYKTNKKSSMLNHIESQKHIEYVEKSEQKLQYIKMKEDYICLRCLKVYKHYQSLSRHNSLNCMNTSHIKSFDDLLKFLQIDVNISDGNHNMDESINIDSINGQIDDVMLRLLNLNKSVSKIEKDCVATRVDNSIKFYV
jgi:hypothetical protein